MESQDRESYEYIVVGSGAGGGPVAANLAAAGHTVLVLEAGGEDQGYLYQVPAFHPSASEDPEMLWQFFVRHYRDPEQARRDPKYVAERDGVFYPRAATLGGCTAHNALIFAYPSNNDWDGLAELTGDQSWNARSMRRYFQRLERNRYRKGLRWLYRLLRLNPSRHGFDGWLTTEESLPEQAVEDRGLRRLVEKSAVAQLFSAGDRLARILSFVVTKGDPNSWWSVRRNQGGLKLVPLTSRGGRRVGSRERLLEVREKHPDRLTIRTHALVTRVLFDGEKRAVGVEYLDGAHLYRADPAARDGGAGEPRRVRATREVILAAGSFNTPQILQLSGVGPPDLLARHGIEVVVPLPGVGENLQDRYEATVVQRMREPFSMLEGSTMVPPGTGEEPDPQFRDWLEGRGVYTTNGSVMSVVRRSTPEAPDPDLFLFLLVTDFRGYYPGYSERVRTARRFLTWAVLKGFTHNHAGRVAIRSADPRDTPQIDFHYFEEGSPGGDADLDAVVDGLEFVRELSAGYGHRVEREEVPGPEVRTRDDLRRYVRDQAWGHHASGTCKIGRPDDPAAVLDSRFRVRGTKGLRVVDASVFPRIPGLFIVSAVYMIGEKASDVILEDAAGTPTPAREREP